MRFWDCVILLAIRRRDISNQMHVGIMIIQIRVGKNEGQVEGKLQENQLAVAISLYSVNKD